MVYLKIFMVGLLLYSALVQLVSRETWWFIQNVNLIFHEAGHVLLMFFGETLAILGGTIFEIGIPLVITGYFYFSQQYFSAACTSWWLATAFLSVSIYASDAQERVLPLITNDITTHDWFNLLTKYNLLKYDDVIGYTFWLGGALATSLIVIIACQDTDIKNSFYNLRKIRRG